MVRLVRVALFALVLLSGTAAQPDDDDYMGEEGGYGDDDDMGGMDGGMGGDMGGGGGGEEEMAGTGPVKTLGSVAEFEEFIDDKDATVVAAFTAREIVDPSATVPDGWDEEEDGAWQPPMIENPAVTAFNLLTGSVYGYRYAMTDAPDVLAQLKSKKGGLYLFKSPKFASVAHGDRLRERFPSDKWTESAVTNWLKAKAQPLVGLYSTATKHRYEGKPVLVIFANLDFEANAKGVAYVLKRARKYAAELKETLKAPVSVSMADLQEYELGDFGLVSKSNADILMGISMGDDRFGFDADTAEKLTGKKSNLFSAKAMEAFVSAYKNGELTPYIKPDVEDPNPEEGEPGLGVGEDDDDDGEGDKDEM